MRYMRKWELSKQKNSKDIKRASYKSFMSQVAHRASTYVRFL